MRHSAYLTASRHGIYYLRWPIPPRLHPARKRRDVKISLRTRCPRQAQHMSRLLAVAGHSAVQKASLRTMRYDEIRQHVIEHFRDLLERLKESVAEKGPRADDWTQRFADSLMLANEPLDNWLELTQADGIDSLLNEFCRKRGITVTLSDTEKQRMAEELQKGYRHYFAGALDHNVSFRELDLGVRSRHLVDWVEDESIWL